VKEFGHFWQIPNDLQKSKGTHSRQVTCGFGDFKAEPDMTLAGEMINLVGLYFGENPTKRCGIVQIEVVQEKLFPVDFRILVKMINAGAPQGAGSADGAMHFVTFGEQQI
jgi:hypothetical protein